MEQFGAGEILLTSMDCDGTKDGYDLALTRSVSDAVHIPSAALAASIFHFREYTINECKEFLLENDVPVRI